MNADGVVDILSGCYSAPNSRETSPNKGMAGFLYVLEGKGGNNFGEAVELKTADDVPVVLPGSEGQKDITKAICTHPFAYDWDQDGDLDLIVGNFAGGLCLIKNEGDAENAQFEPEGTYLKAGEEDLIVPGYHGAPFVIDWDGDGDQDILSGSGRGGVYWAENQGTHLEPEFASFTEVIAPPPGDKAHQQFLKGDDEPIPASGTRLWVVDYNHDGKQDLLVGDNLTVQRAKEGETEEDVAKRQEVYQEKMQLVSQSYSEVAQKLQEAEGDEKKELEEEMKTARDEMMKLYNSRGDYINEQRTGFVWLYLQQ